MYKYKQTTDVEIGDLVVWTELIPNNPHITKDKVYQVIDKINNNLVTVLSDNNTEVTLGKAQGFKVLQTKPASEAVVGDYMYRISSGTDAFPQHTIIKITETDIRLLYYKPTRSVCDDEVIVIAQAEPEVKYPLFMQSVEYENVFVKFIANTKGTCMLNGKYNAGMYSSSWKPHQSKYWEPCDFTIEPEIFDIDWWQARYEEELPVYVRDGSGPVYQCIALPPKDWSKCCTFGMTYSSLIQQAPTIPKSAISFALYPSGAPSEPTQTTTTKEQPMNKTTLKLLLELLGASEEVKDTTNSKFVGIITNEDEYVGYMYFDSKEDATECMAQPKMELHKLHLFEKSCVLAQKPRKVIEI